VSTFCLGRQQVAVVSVEENILNVVHPSIGICWSESYMGITNPTIYSSTLPGFLPITVKSIITTSICLLQKKIRTGCRQAGYLPSVRLDN
jgi:hypothetical protein